MDQSYVAIVTCKRTNQSKFVQVIEFEANELFKQ